MKTQAHRPAENRQPAVQKQQAGTAGQASRAGVAASKRADGLPDTLKSGIEQLSGHAMDDVKVHYNSSKPAGLQAHAYAQGTDIHLGPGREKHLPHEAWHVVQQKQGRVKATTQAHGAPVNDNPVLEAEADRMGGRAASAGAKGTSAHTPVQRVPSVPFGPVQRKVGFEFEMSDIQTQRLGDDRKLTPHGKGDILSPEFGYDITADINDGGSQLEFVTGQFDETNDADLDELEFVAGLIEADIRNIVDTAAQNPQGSWVQASKVPGIASGKQNDLFFPKKDKAYTDLPGQLQMTGGLDIHALAKVLSGSAMPDRPHAAQGGSVYQDYAFNYQQFAPSGALQQPIFQAAMGAVKGFVTETGTKKKGIASKIRAALGAVVALMAQVPLNMHGQLNMEGQAQFLARTDYSKILKMICDEAGIHLDRDSFAHALLSTINQISRVPFTLKDDIFPEDYRSAGQKLTGVTIGDWARGVVPTAGKYWGRWQGTDLVTKKNFPGTPQQKNELRPFGGFGNKTDPGNKVVLEWRNFQMMNADHLAFTMRGLAEYLKGANEK